MSTVADQDRRNDWYVLGAHTRRAIEHLGAALVERGYLPPDFEQPVLLELWGEALGETMEPQEERSPIHADEGGGALVERETTCEWHARIGDYCEPLEEDERGKGTCPW